MNQSGLGPILWWQESVEEPTEAVEDEDVDMEEEE